MDDAHDDVEDKFPDLPENLQSIVEHIGLLDELANEAAEAMYARLRDGRCMTCEGPLKEDTILLLNKHGIVGGYCSGPCMQDMAVLGWVQEQHDDIQDAIKFRGGRGDVAEG